MLLVTEPMAWVKAIRPMTPLFMMPPRELIVRNPYRVSAGRWAPGGLALLADDRQQFLRHLVGRRDRLGVGRIGALGDDHVRELVAEIGVRAFERRRGDDAGTAGVG